MKPMALPTRCTTAQKVSALVIAFLSALILWACIVMLFVAG